MIWTGPPHHLHPHQIIGLRVIEVQCQLLHQCHQGPIDLQVPGIHAAANGTAGSLEATWKQPASLHERCCYLPKLVLGLNGVLLCWVLRLHPSPLCYPFSTGLPRGVGEEFGDRYHSSWCIHYTAWALKQCQGLRCFEPGALSAMNGWKRDSIWLGCVSVKTPSGFHGIIPGMLSSRPCSWAEVWPLLWWAA